MKLLICRKRGGNRLNTNVQRSPEQTLAESQMRHLNRSVSVRKSSWFGLKSLIWLSRSRMETIWPPDLHIKTQITSENIKTHWTSRTLSWSRICSSTSPSVHHEIWIDTLFPRPSRLFFGRQPSKAPLGPRFCRTSDVYSPTAATVE